MRKKDFIIAVAGMILLSSAVVIGYSQRQKINCVHIFYDQTLDSHYNQGRDYALMLQRLLIYFPEFVQVVSPIESYKPGDLNSCPVNFYIGSAKDNPLPIEFLNDFVKTRTKTTWIGFNIWQLGPRLGKSLGVEFLGLTTDEGLNPNGSAIFQDILYKGLVYKKVGFLKRTPAAILSAKTFEQVEIRLLDSSKTQVLAESRHNVSNRVIPYIVRTNNFFYIADIPFSEPKKTDRYLVFVDLLFDILGTEPQRKDLFAVIKKDL